VVAARDASGAVIVGPGNYLQPITLSNNDTTGGTTLSKTTLTSPSDAVTLSYDGTSYVDPVISSSPGPAANASPPRLVPEVQATEVAIPSGSKVRNGMVLGSDGAMWFSEWRGIGRVSAGGSITEFPFTDALMGPGPLALGSDGNVWFDGAIDNVAPPAFPPSNSAVGFITPGGSITSYPVNSSGYPLSGIIKGPDNNIWFGYSNNSIGLVGPGGAITKYSPTFGNDLNIQVTDLTTAPDGNIWIVDGGLSEILKYVIATNTVTAYPTPPDFPGAGQNVQPYRVIEGTDGDLYASSVSMIFKFDTGGNILATYPFDNVFASVDAQLAAGHGAVWVPLGLDNNQHPLIGRVAANGAYAEIALPETGTIGDSAAPISAMVMGPDNVMWYVRDTSVGHYATY
jgi:streptogramin lyase